MRFEAQAAAGLGIACIYSPRAEQLEKMLVALLDRLGDHPPRGIMSFGTVGALAPDLECGQWIVARCIIDHDGITRYTDPGWSIALLRLYRSARYAPVISSPRALLTPQDKRHAFQMTGAYAVDMESDVVARVAMRYNLPFVVARVVLDRSTDVIPQIALLGLKDDGTTQVGPVIKGLLRNPRELKPLLRLARAAARARRALDQGRASFGVELGFPKLSDND
jgi:hypothetical protein